MKLDSAARGGGENTCSVDESRAERAVMTASQRLTWVLGQALRLGFRFRVRYPRGRLRREPGEPLILALNHERVLDPWLAVSAFGWRTWLSLAPVRILGTRDWTGLYRWFAPLSRLMYRLYGVIELPPRSAGASRGEKLAGLVSALRRGQAVAIFPEGHVREPNEPPVRPFQVGVVDLHRRTGVPVVPMAIRLGERRLRRPFVLTVGRPVTIPEQLDLPGGAEWLRRRVRELYDLAP